MIGLLSLVAVAAPIAQPDTIPQPTVITLEQAIEIALSENISVKVADQEIARTQYAKRGTYASLFPQIDGSASYQRTIKRQVMYMDFDMGAFKLPGSGGSSSSTTPAPSSSSSSSGKSDTGGGIEVGRLNTWSAGLSASMPLVNAQLWKSLAISGQDVELAVEKARESRLNMITQVKTAYYGVLMAKEAFDVYRQVYENACENLKQVEMMRNVDKVSELDYVRAKTNVANAIPNLYDSRNSVALALWQLKAVMGVDLDLDLDIAGSLHDYTTQMFYDIHRHDDPDISANSSMRQLAIQAEELANAVKLQKLSTVPSLALAFSYNVNAMANNYDFREYNWSPYSFVGLTLSIPIFAGGKRFHAIKQAQVQANQLDLQRQEAERQLRIGIRQQLMTMETAMNSLTSARSAVESAQKAYDIAAKAYNVGRSTLTDLNSAQLALTQARLSETQAIYSFVTAKASLEQLLGVDYENQ